jgi:hypothetical protein
MAPRSVARGAPRSGGRAAAGMPDRATVLLGCQQPATGSHLHSEDMLRPARSHHSRRRLSCIPSRKAAVAPVRIYSALP